MPVKVPFLTLLFLAAESQFECVFDLFHSRTGTHLGKEEIVKGDLILIHEFLAQK